MFIGFLVLTEDCGRVDFGIGDLGAQCYSHEKKLGEISNGSEVLEKCRGLWQHDRTLLHRYKIPRILAKDEQAHDPWAAYTSKKETALSHG